LDLGAAASGHETSRSPNAARGSPSVSKLGEKNGAKLIFYL
jgi:hypothetical protein